MSDVPGLRMAIAGRSIGILAIVLGLAACAPVPESTQHLTYLPASTPRAIARVEREKQLVTGTYRDDIPEFTGAPSPRTASWPAYVPERGKTTYRSDYVTTVPPTR